MTEICPKCGLPKDICVCSILQRTESRISILLETRKGHHVMTVVRGVADAKEREDLSKKLRCLCACGGSVKGDRILLQGDHRSCVADFLIKTGYPKETIEIV